MGEGWFYCKACQDKFTVRTGTVYERSHIPLHKWLLAFRLMASSKKGISAHQLGRTLGITYKSAWFMAHRVREAMADPAPSPMGGEGKTIEADETYIGKRKRYRGKARLVSNVGWVTKPPVDDLRKIVSLVERGGSVRSFHVDRVNSRTLGKVLLKNVDRTSGLMTDEARYYMRPGHKFAEHHSVNHSIKEYVRGRVHTNTIEGYFSIFKRGMKGVYQHCSEKHLHRYLAEFDFRYSNRVAIGADDVERTTRAIKGAEGKRLMYRQPDGQVA
jgi:hypothetical protein